jgi:hypothetical protein
VPFNHPKPLPPLSKAEIDRYLSKVGTRSEDECWPWLGSTDKDGYGNFFSNQDGRRYCRATRIGYLIHFGKDPFPDLIRHTCDNPPCQNPAHWLLGSPGDNVRDREERGRGAGALIAAIREANGTTARGDSHGTKTHPEKVRRGTDVNTNIITAEQVLEVRRLYAIGDHSQLAIAGMFGIAQTNVSSIVLRKSWKHI